MPPLAGVLLLVALAPQGAPRPRDLPLANDCELTLVPSLANEIARGDELARAFPRPLGDAATPEALAQAFDAWHRALALGASDPTALVALPDEQGGALRGGESAAFAVQRRLEALGPAGWRAWRARFEALAQSELALQPIDEAALERFAAAHAGTESAVRSALRAADLARERGDDPRAAAALSRARAQGPLDPSWRHAIEVRERALSAPAEAPRAMPQALELLAVRELSAAAAGGDWVESRRAGPALAELGDGRLAWSAAGSLALVEADGTLHEVDLRALADAREWNWTLGFRDAHSPFSAALLAQGSRVVLTLGRAHADEGNLVAGLELAPGVAPALAWAWCGHGEALGRANGAPALPGGLWSFQGGAVLAGDAVCVLAQRFEGSADAPARVDELRAETWCLCLALADGAPRWIRKLGRGSDPATRDPARLPEARGVCAPADPLGLAPGTLWCSSALGWVSAIALDGGRVQASWRAGLEKEAPGERVLLAPPLELGAGALWSPAGSRWCYPLEPGAGCEVLPRGEGRVCVARDARRAWWLAGGGGAWHVETVPSASPLARRSVDLPRGEDPQAVCSLGPDGLALATDRALYLLDDRGAARITCRATLPAACARTARGSGTLHASGERLACAVGSTLALFRLR